MKALYVGKFTGVATVKIISKHWDRVLKVWMYKCKSTARTNRFYKTGYEFFCRPSELCLKVTYRNKGCTLIQHGYIDAEEITIGNELK